MTGAADVRPILIVDDEPEMRALLREYLESLGHAVLEAGNGLEGLWAIKHHRPRLVLLDLNMPRLGGLDAVRHIRKFDPSIRIVVVSGYIDEATGARLEELRVPALAKPVSLAALSALLEPPAR